MKQRDRAETLRRMTDAAGRAFRAHGYAGIGVAGVAKAAGVTTGALYDHFGSKDGAFAAAMEAGLEEVVRAVPRFQAEHGPDWLAAFARYYLGREHRGDGERLCAMTALSPDVARGEPAHRARFEARMTEIARLMADGLPPSGAEPRDARAWRALGLLIGGLTLARAMDSDATADRIAEAVIAAVASV